jgi:hypothetical protein
MIKSISYFLMFSSIYSGVTPVCPLKCPSCTKCDTKTGTCTLPRDFVSCTSKTIPGICYAGVCNPKFSLTPTPAKAVGKCTNYNCDSVTGTCVFSTRPDGYDCSTVGAVAHSVCKTGVCKNIVFGLSDPAIFPWRNVGCIGIPNGTPCDTNDVFDNESCLDGVCKFPDGSYYGYLPGTI